MKFIRIICLLGIFGVLLTPHSVQAVPNIGDGYKQFDQLYLDATASSLTGLSATQMFTLGWRKEQQAFYLQVMNAWSDTLGTSSLYQYTSQGITLSGGIRYYLPGDAWYVFASEGILVCGPYAGSFDPRVGLVGSNEWNFARGKVIDLYSDCTYVNLYQDTYFTLRIRDGKILSQHGNSRIWAYAIGNLQADSAGSNGLSNRIEAGIGLGYRTYEAPFGLSATLDFRLGDSFRGAIAHRHYSNPMFVISGGF